MYQKYLKSFETEISHSECSTIETNFWHQPVLFFGLTANQKNEKATDIELTFLHSDSIVALREYFRLAPARSQVT